MIRKHYFNNSCRKAQIFTILLSKLNINIDLIISHTIINEIIKQTLILKIHKLTNQDNIINKNDIFKKNNKI